jgi:hypothetical protein
MFTPLTVIRNKSRGSWSVCLYHKDSKRRYWLDISLDEKYHDLEVEWNQYIFYLTDPDDVERKEFQEDDDNFDEASSEAVCILENLEEVFIGEDGDWYLKGEWEGEKTWNL